MKYLKAFIILAIPSFCLGGGFSTSKYVTSPSTGNFVVTPYGISASTIVTTGNVLINGASAISNLSVNGGIYSSGHITAGSVSQPIGNAVVDGFSADGSTVYGVYGENQPQTGNPTTAFGVFGLADGQGNTEIGVAGTCSPGTTNPNTCTGGNFTVTGGASTATGVGISVLPSLASSSQIAGVNASVSGFAPLIYGEYSAVTSSATNAAYGGFFESVGASSKNFGIQAIVQNATTNYGAYLDANSGTNNYGLYVNSGQVQVNSSTTIQGTVQANAGIVTSTITVSSNTILSGATFYANSTPIIGSALFQGPSDSTATYGLTVGSITLNGQTNTAILFMNGKQLATSSVFEWNGSTMTATAIKVGTATITGYLSVQASTSNVDIAIFSTSSVGGFGVDISTFGHFNVFNSSVTLGPTFTNGSGDASCSDTACTGTASGSPMTMTFARAWTKTPVCVVTERTDSLMNVLSYTVSTTAVVVTQTGLSGSIVDIICVGRD